MRRFLDWLYRGAAALAALMVLAIAVLMVLQSIGRELGWRMGAINDIVAWCCAAAAFLAMAQAFRHGDFVRVTLGLDKASPAWRHRLELFCLLVAAAATAYLAWWAGRFTYESWEFNDLAQGLLPMPLWIPQLAFALGALLLWVAVLDELVTVLRGGRPSYVVAVEERHAQGDFSSDI